MNKKIRTWSGRLFRLFTIVIAILYLLVCLVPFLDPGKFWFVAVLGLGFPFLLGILILCIIIWIIKKSKKWTIALLVVLLLGWQQISVVLGMHFFHPKFDAAKEANTIRVLSWNVSRWDEQNKEAKGGVSFRQLMMDAVYTQGADVLCFQEFFEPVTPGRFDKNIEAVTRMGYPYHYFFPSSSIWNGELKFGLAIFSRFPIVDSNSLSFGYTPHSEGLAYVDINADGKRCRVFTFHMESARVGKVGYFEAESARRAAGSLKRAYALRTAQGQMVSEEIKASPYPVIVCGNLGDLPNSYAYFKVRDGLNDVFLKKGLGFGATFRFFSPTLRVEYFFTSKDFDILQYHRPEYVYSDHYPIITDLRLK